jgi:hypothetical protein
MPDVKRNLILTDESILLELVHEVLFFPFGMESVWQQTKKAVVKWTVKCTCFSTHDAIKLDLERICFLGFRVGNREFVYDLLTNIFHWD